LAGGVHLFKPVSAYRVQRDTYTDTPLPPDEPVSPNPPDGAIVDYYLPSNANSVTLEVLDRQEKVVRRYAHTDKPEISDADLQRQLIPLYWPRASSRLSTDAGMHRWVWDLHYATPTTTRHEYPISAIPHDTPRYPLGPNALPGNYTVRLTVDGKSSTASLTLKMDPRVKTASAGLQKKFQAEARLAGLMSETSEAVLQAGSIRTQLEKLKLESADAKSAVEGFQKKLTILLGAPGGFFAPPSEEVTLSRVNGEVGTLYQSIWQADAEPTSSQVKAAEKTEHESTEVLTRWRELKNTDVPALNKVLRQSQAPELKIETEPHSIESGVDLDEE